MFIVRWFKIRKHERGLYFRDGEFKRLLGPGRHVFFDPFRKVKVVVVSVRYAWLSHKDLDVIARSGALEGQAQVIDLKDHERALVWLDGRFETVLRPGQFALWTVFRDVRVEIVETGTVRFEHKDLAVILKTNGTDEALNSFTVEPAHVGLLFKDGEHMVSLRPGTHAFWEGAGRVKINHVDLREKVLDVAGQEIMTADKVTLRLNAVVTYRVVDALKAVTAVEDYAQALYREAQLALRGVIGTKDLDALLANKDAVADELESIVKNRASACGLEVIALGIRDVILPGEMKDLMNKVTEAKKAAEASLITRREETAAMRSQANTAKILENNQTLMRLRELEVLEKVADKAKLNVILGEQGLVDRVVKLL